MIPKKIHYCWFGGNPLDETSLKCINSWKKFFPDYEIIQWDESNFDVSQIDFMQKAYLDKKWAFVSDVARLLLVYEHGGLYFDTDVEVIAKYDDILTAETKGFLGFEKTNAVNSGLGFGAEPKHPFLKDLIEIYKKTDYSQHVDCLQSIACPILTTTLLLEKGYVLKDALQECAGFKIYPSEYFSPIDYETGALHKTSLTHSIHWYNASWNSVEDKKALATAQRFRRIFGKKLGDHIAGILSCIKKEGLFHYIKKRLIGAKETT